MSITPIPNHHVDPFDPQFTLDPFESYRQWRELGRIVKLPSHDTWVLPGYAEVHAALAAPEVFSTAYGTGLLENLKASSVIASDPEKHLLLRSVLAEKLAPRALRAMREEINAKADQVVAAAVERRQIDAVADIAQTLPVTIVADLIGLPIEGRERLLPGADVVNQLFGPLTPEVQAQLPDAGDYFAWMSAMCDRNVLTPNSWGMAVLDAVDEGRIEREDGIWLMNGYLVAGMDTTVNAISSLLHLFATRPEIWQQLKQKPELRAAAFEEILRLESPVQGFFRVTTEDLTFDGAVLPAGSRVLLSFASANRDARHFDRPEEFLLERRPNDHIAFGFGQHGCAGQGLARLEAAALLASMLRRIDRFELVGKPTRRVHPVVRGWETLPVEIVTTS